MLTRIAGLAAFLCGVGIVATALVHAGSPLRAVATLAILAAVATRWWRHESVQTDELLLWVGAALIMAG